MTSFPDELHNYLAELGAEVSEKENETPFVLLKDRLSGLTIHAVSPSIYNKQHLSPTFFQEMSNRFQLTGQRLIHCWEDLWNTRREIIQSRLGSLFGQSIPIHGRACKIRRPAAQEAERFLEENHLIGTARGTYWYGLYLDSRLVALALFGRSVPVQRNGVTFKSHELIRYCTARDHYVQGGLSKLIKSFIREVGPDDIYTAVDRDWSNGESFRTIGFKVIGYTDPLPFWLDNAGYRHRKPPRANAPKVINSGNVQLLLPLKNE